MRLNRYSAAAANLALSAVIAGAVLLAIDLAWYPQALFRLAGAQRLFLVIACVNLVLGPLLTLIVYVPGKKGLKFDLVAIVVVQVAAFVGGIGVLFVSRPVYVVFVKDRFELVRANDFPRSELARAGSSPFKSLPLAGPQFVGARMPADAAERERIMFLAPSGIDLQHMLQHYVPYDAVRAEVKAAALPFPKLRELNRGREGEVDRAVRELARDEASLAFLPMRAGDADVAVIVDRANGDELKMLDLNPWVP